jgi:bacterioferritin-associated ferredoxin
LNAVPETTAERTIICRCEDLSLAEIRAMIAAGAVGMDEIKRLTRCGMGPCQGRTCRQLVAAEIARATGRDISEVALPTFRPPTKPVKLGVLLATEDGEEDSSDPAAGPMSACLPGEGAPDLCGGARHA